MMMVSGLLGSSAAARAGASKRDSATVPGRDKASMGCSISKLFMTHPPTAGASRRQARLRTRRARAFSARGDACLEILMRNDMRLRSLRSRAVAAANFIWPPDGGLGSGDGRSAGLEAMNGGADDDARQHFHGVCRADRADERGQLSGRRRVATAVELSTDVTQLTASVSRAKSVLDEDDLAGEKNDAREHRTELASA